MSRPPDGAGPTPEPAILKQAAEWFAALEASDATEQTRQRWQAWLDASECHQRAWARVLYVQEQFNGAMATQHGAATEHALDAARQGRSRRRTLGLLSLIGVGTMLAWSGLRQSFQDTNLRAATGEIRDITLPDGTRAWLSPGTTVAVEYAASRRSLRLIKGEVLIETSHDNVVPARPFFVRTGSLQMQALGTRFSVRAVEPRVTTLAVFAGAVEAANQQNQRQVVQQGRQLQLYADGRMDESAAEPAREAWRDGILLADNMPLAAFLAELGRFRHGYLGYDESVADLRVAGAFPLTDSDRALVLLSQSLPIKLISITPWWVMVQAR